MNTRSFLLGGLFLVLFMLSCQQEGGKKKKNTTEEQKTETRSHQHESHGAEVRLNDGEPWEANPETTEGIARMKQLIESFEAGDSIETYRRLNAELMNEYQYIFRECTMKGESHEQLHNYLLPLKDQFEKLQSGDLTDSREAYRTIAKHLGKYSDYFK